eukprot:TRINITY_DN4393_c0_g2_i3.p1 TRINITY_DN4393_c0_g2~~TRINITY_DN4393_c0_g2_i3.p1  ORF type:complete len:639 (+),score=56.77 TRINITY_DN4393_c0_g2_i3:75-1991(+)
MNQPGKEERAFKVRFEDEHQSETYSLRSEGEQKIDQDRQELDSLYKRNVYLRKMLTRLKSSFKPDPGQRSMNRCDNIRQREIEAIEGAIDTLYNNDEQQEEQSQSWREYWFGNSHGLIHPASRFRHVWDICLVIVIFYTCFQAPFKWAFEPPRSAGATTIYFSTPVIFFYVIEIIVDILYIFDMMFNQKTGYRAMGGAVMDPQLIRRNYFKKQFIYDLLPSIVIIFDILFPWVSHPMTFRFIKLLQLLKLKGFYPRFGIVSEAIANQFTTLHSAIASLFCALVVISNWLACIWFFTQTVQKGGIGNSWLSTLEDLTDSVDQWLNAENEGNGNVPYSSRLQLYVAAFYWSSSAGDGFAATTTSERVCAIVGQFLVVNGMGAFIIASIMRALDDFDIESQKHNMYRRKIDGVNSFMCQHKLPKELQRSVRRFYHEVWTREKLDFTEVQMLEELPFYLRHPIMQHITRQMITTSKFFDEFLGEKDGLISTEDSKRWADAISSVLKPLFATPMEYIIKQGESGTNMFMIKQGKVAVEVDGKMVATQSSGSYFGEVALLGSTMICRLRTASIRAITYCELFTLQKDDLEQIFKSYPALQEVMLRTAQAKIRRNVSKQISEQARQMIVDEVENVNNNISRLDQD